MEPLYQVTQWRTKEELRQLYWHRYRRSVINWVNFCFTELYLLTCAILLLLFWRFSLVPLVLGLMVLWIFLVRRNGNRTVERQYSSDPAMQNSPYHYVFEADGVTIITVRSQRRVSYSRVTGLYEIKNHLCLKTRSGTLCMRKDCVPPGLEGFLRMIVAKQK